MANELLTKNKEFDYNHEREPHHETEKKLLPVFPEQLEEWRERARPVEQLYLSNPDEPYSLRLRAALSEDGALTYTATLKDRGVHTEDGLRRLEIETPIAADTYHHYAGSDLYPVIRKMRANPTSHIYIDFHDDNTVLLEAEHPLSLRSFLDSHHCDLVDITGDRIADNEWRAHFNYRRSHAGQETLVPGDELDPNAIARDIIRSYQRNPLTISAIAGRSGSGKSTLIRQIQEELAAALPDVPIAVLSTDNYHRGKTWLEQYNNGEPWTNWDAEIVYDIEALVHDLYSLGNGQSVVGRRFDFITQEPVVDGVVTPSPIILLEGIYASHPALQNLTHLDYELPTPLATCIGRRLARDFDAGERVNDSLGEPETILRYLIEVAEPTYQAQPSRT